MGVKTFSICFLVLFGLFSRAEIQNAPATAPVAEAATTTATAAVSTAATMTKEEITDFCINRMGKLPGKKLDADVVKALCSRVDVKSECYSAQHRPIMHFDRLAREKKDEKRILTIALIHGNEALSGSVAKAWMNRLDRMDPRNYWRVIPISNPDGMYKNTRVNSNGVDLNRNFPTKDWATAALSNWKKAKKSDPRKFPGFSAESEPETRCLVSHIKEFKPDFIISIHTPFGVLDFDGPRMPFPKFSPLPWIAMGNYPGSLGRYMWVDHETPVLTIELKGDEGVRQLESFDQLQDISGTIAIQAAKILDIDGKKTSKQ